MKILEELHGQLARRAAETRIARVSIGLAYTAVATDDDGIGLACTMLESPKTCMVTRDLPDFEGGPASKLLDYLLTDEPLGRGLALALVNALRHADAVRLPEDRDNTILFDRLGIAAGTRVSMVGNFVPVARKLRNLGADVDIVDLGRGEGDEAAFMEKLGEWTDALVITSTALLNGTAESFLAAAAPRVRVAMLGPSTPLLAGPFAQTAVRVLCGTVPVDVEQTFRAIRHGRGTPVLQRFARKPYLVVSV